MAQSQQREEKLKPLLNDLPPGYLVDAAWLVARNIDRKSIFNYVENGWLEKVARGVYRRPDPEIFAVEDQNEWRRTVLSIQHLLQWHCHVGGQTAMALAGFEHYVRFDDAAPIYLYGKTPSWMKRLPNADRFRLRTNALFGTRVGISGATESAEDSPAQTSAPRRLIQSTPERAILEWLNELPNKTTFHAVDVVFEGLATLRPKLLMSLLQDCSSIKVKRLFFVFADRHNHAWRKHIAKDQIEMGVGPRALVKGGKIHPAHLIYVPSEYLPLSEGDADDGP
ncbi:type IV toxin-antitoxin system AbiEi family antitoxin domain-containing protein [Nitratireductor sp. XY-223]|uniref:type IV toxin-antitoxin system AbiEi family antitoxin domain-containing protein n=1 Tax=Nitratireductor sp. XY-223 TaxID=2561926 RepID=UPI0010AB0AF7|nr:type IV toxin-antitoxin system AbiEi family antitoxin domain-containing protein [Nitratireductor sp. XY-223]